MASPFNPDQFLTETDPGFNPDKFLQETAPAPRQQGFLERAGRATVNALPMIGGVAGGILGTPADAVTGPAGSMVGAGIGGYLGTAAKNAINSYIDPEEAPKTLGAAVLDPIVGGAEQGALEGVGNAVAPALKRLSDPVANYLKHLAEKKAIAATGVSGAQVFNKFPENAGRELLDRGIVTAGSNQAGIAKNATSALNSSRGKIGAALTALDEQGAQIPQSKIIDELRGRSKVLSQDAASLDVSDGLGGLANRLERGAEDATEMTAANTAEGPLQTLSEAEKTKRGFQNKVNYNGSSLDNSVNKEAAGVYRNAVESEAVATNPELAEAFAKEKKDYALLSPIEEAASKKAAVNDNSHGLNLNHLGSRALGAAVGGEEGHRHGGIAGGLAGAAAGALVAPRMTSTFAVGADRLADVFKAAPSAFGKFAPTLSNAAARGSNSLAATDYILQQSNPEYRQQRDRVFSSKPEDSNE